MNANMKSLVLAPVSPSDRLNVLGHDIWIRLSGADTGGSLTLFEQHSAPGSGVPLHVHANDCESFCIVSGQVEFTLDGAAHHLGPGATVFVPIGARHGLRVVGSATARMLIVTAPSGIECMFRELDRTRTTPPDMEQVAAICARHGIKFF